MQALNEAQVHTTEALRAACSHGRTSAPRPTGQVYTATEPLCPRPRNPAPICVIPVAYVSAQSPAQAALLPASFPSLAWTVWPTSSPAPRTGHRRSHRSRLECTTVETGGSEGLASPSALPLP